MRVWIESPFDNLPMEGFRKQRYWLMAEAFAEAGHEVVYFTGDFNHGTKQKRDMVGREGNWRKDIRLVVVDAGRYDGNVSLRRVFSHLKYAHSLSKAASKLEKPDLVIAATPTLTSALVMGRAARKFGARFVLDIQDAWPETFQRLFPNGFKWMGAIALWPMRVLAGWLYRSADVVSGVSRRYQDVCGRKDYYLAYHGI